MNFLGTKNKSCEFIKNKKKITHFWKHTVKYWLYPRNRMGKNPWFTQNSLSHPGSAFEPN